MMILIGALTIASMCGCLSFGNTNIISVYGVDLRAYRMELVIIMICGGLNAYVYCLYYVVTVTGKQIFYCWDMGAGLIFAVFLDRVS